MFSLSAQTPRKDSGADGLPMIKALKVGDTVPEALWDTSFDVIKYPNHNAVIKLADYRDKKLIVLDFWATWCASCVEGLYKSQTLEKFLNGQIKIIPVNSKLGTRDTKDRINDTFTKIAEKDFIPFSIYDNGILDKYFPHEILPHLVWINQTGKVVAVTSSGDLNVETIKKMIDSEGAIPSSPKYDISNFDRTAALLFQENISRLGQDWSLTTFSKGIAGLPQTAGTYLKNKNGYYLYRATNQPLIYYVIEGFMDQYNIAAIKPFQYIFSEQLSDTLSALILDAPKNKNAYLLEIASSKELNPQMVRRTIRNLLEEKFNFKVSVIKRKEKILIAYLEDKHKLNFSNRKKGNRYENLYSNSGSKTISNYNIHLLFGFLSSKLSVPIENRTGLKERIELVLPEQLDLSDKKQVVGFLHSKGIRIEEEESEQYYLQFETVY